MNIINVYKYEDYKEFLLDWHEMKSINSKTWSLGRFAYSIGVSNTAAISNIVKGRKIPSYNTVEEISKLINLNKNESLYLHLLVEKVRHKKIEVIVEGLNQFADILKTESI